MSFKFDLQAKIKIAISGEHGEVIDRAHEMAAQTMIKTIRDGLKEVPVLMGTCVSA
jgi:hypothetical protein